MNVLQSKENILKLCNAIVSSRHESCEETNDLLKLLKILCCGFPEERLSRFYSQYCFYEKSIGRLLKTSGVISSLERNPKEAESVVVALLNIPTLGKDLGEALAYITAHVKSIFSNKEIFDRLIYHKDSGSLPPAIIENVLLENSINWEIDFLDLYANKNSASGLLKHWVNWSHRSSKLYQTLTSIMNEFFLKCKDKSRVVEIISDFVNQTMSLSGDEFVSLYPHGRQMLVALMMIDPNSLFSSELELIRTIIVSELRSAKLAVCEQYISLAIHFPNWNKLLKL